MNSFYLRQADQEDTDNAMRLIHEAKEFLKAQGVDQWQTDYPNLQTIQEDIQHGRGFVVMDGKTTAAYLCIDFEGEPAYSSLKGEWKSELPYVVIHRLAISGAYKGQGLASIIFKLAEDMSVEKGVNSVRVDTDEDNAIMRHVLDKNGYEYCGTIWFQNSVKIAYEKCL